MSQALRNRLHNLILGLALLRMHLKDSTDPVVARTLDGLEQDATLGQSIVTKNIGVIGHSAGGYAALLSAGGTPDFSQFVRGRCDREAKLGSDRPKFVHNSPTSTTSDDRIRAVAAMAPALARGARMMAFAAALPGGSFPVRPEPRTWRRRSHSW